MAPVYLRSGASGKPGAVQSSNRRASEEHVRRTGILTKFRADHVTGVVVTKIDALRDFERERSAHLSTLGLGASKYLLMRRQLRNWPDLRERWLKASSSDPDHLLKIAKTEQARLRGRFGDPAVFAWLAAAANQHIWRAEPDAVSLLTLLNAMEALVKCSRETALMTLPDPVAHPRAVQWSAVGDNNLRPYRISANDRGECRAQLRLLVPREGDSLLVDQERTFKLAPSKQFEARVFTMRGKKAAVTFKATGQDTLVGVIGSADLQLDRKHMEHRLNPGCLFLMVCECESHRVPPRFCDRYADVSMGNCHGCGGISKQIEHRICP